MNVISHPKNEIYLKQKLHQTLSSFKGADIIQRKTMPCCPLTILKGDKRCDSLMENGVKLNQSFKKRAILIVRQPIVVQSNQSRRNGFININLNYKQEIHISPNPLQQKNHQIQKLAETSLPENEINLNEVQNHSNVAIPQINQQPMKSMETGQSTYNNGKAHALEQLGGRKLQQPMSSIGLLNTTRDSDSKIDLMQVDDISKILYMGDYSTPATISPIISIPKKDPPCIFNQNPADIADADDKRYFTTVENQRIRDKS
ncbi:hypothetical protein R3W88_011906 [Solanum pinnatisectum]|uniref:Uncharacterized protein n=1 Tax=Solanum pinnatisectum TaxID=50273 RepID=A0AAV9L885_9SOLN|nr:hypothetical protein R3W88_011906 [Solanum pinnatisectum]